MAPAAHCGMTISLPIFESTAKSAKCAQIAHLMLFKLSDYRAAYEACMKVPGRGCRNCPVRPREVIQNVPTDWSDRENKLIPAGDAFVGEVDFAKYVNC